MTKPKKITLWQKFKMMFIKPRISVDYADEKSESESCAVKVKIVDGITIVQDVKFFKAAIKAERKA